MNKIYINISETRLQIIDYNLACAIFFIPATVYVTYKLKKISRIIKEKLEKENKLKELEKLYKVLKASGSP